MKAKKDRLVLIRGGGDVASGVAFVLFSYGFKVIITELSEPTVVRRMASFAEALYRSEVDVMGLVAKRVENVREAFETIEEGKIPVLVDPRGETIVEIRPNFLVDARMMKKNLDTKITDAPIVIGVGPGFKAGREVHAIVESTNGPKMGEVIYEGKGEEDTRVPVEIMGYTFDRVLWSPTDGVFRTDREIGDHIEEGNMVAQVDHHSLRAQISGVISGLLHSGLDVKKGEKVAEIDPRDMEEYCYIIYDKSLKVGGGVLKAILTLEKKRNG